MDRRAFICRHCRLALRTQRRQYGSATRAYFKERHSTPFRIGIVGSGPAGFYAAGKILQKIENARVDMYERLPVPFGLVRYGVAPDHPEVKNCQDRFEEIASSPNFNFVGNVEVGQDISLSQLATNYNALLFAYGASEDKELGMPGENLQGIFSARSFVGWYNGAPGHQHVDIERAIARTENVVLLGQGNVALDIARVLLADVDQLRKTDMSAHALEALSKSKVRRVDIVGRRGPMQAAFTIKEVRELLTLPSVSFDPISQPPMPSVAEVASLPRQQKRIAQLLLKGSHTDSASAAKSWALRFLLSPTSFNPDDGRDSSHLDSITFSPTRFRKDEPHTNKLASVERDPDSPDITIATRLAVRSVGYKSQPLPAFSSISVPFDSASGTIPNDLHGRVLAAPNDPTSANLPCGTGPGPITTTTTVLNPIQRHVPGMYCAGWVKRGPTGVIASTMEDAHMTAEAVAADWFGGAPFIGDGGGDGATKEGWEGVRRHLDSKNVRHVDWEGWKRIDEVERQRGAAKGKPREKIVDVEEMLRVLDT